MQDRPRVLPEVVLHLAEREMQLCLIGAIALVGRNQALHGLDLGIRQRVVLEIRKTPVGLRDTRIHRQRRLVGRFAVGAPAKGFLHVANGHAQPNSLRLKPRRLLVGREGLLLAHELRRHGGNRDPALGVIGLHLDQAPRRCFRLREASERREREPHSSPGERMVCGLLQGMTQQPLGIQCLVSFERQGRKTAQGRQVTRVLLQDTAENWLRGLVIVGHESGGGRLDAGPMRIGEAGALVGNARVRILLQVDQGIAVRKPGEMIMRLFLQHPTHFLARRLRTPLLSVRARKVRACGPEAGSRGHRLFERHDGLGDLILGEQRLAEKAQTVDLARFSARHRTTLDQSVSSFHSPEV